MDRRDSLKSLVFGSIGVGVLLQGCDSGVDSETVANSLKKFNYVRTPSEKEYDKLLFSKKCFTNNQMKLISEISNLILPPNEFGSVNDAEVPELIEFMAKDIPSYEKPLKEGLVALNQHSNKKFQKVFIDCDENQQKSILDLMAFPDPELSNSEQSEDIKWFSLFRNLTMTGYYTSKVGIKELGYKGNTPNVWDGVPQDVLDKYGLSYDKEWLDKCVDQTKRNDVAQWDEEGNLIT